jgi:hypothetical protein
MPRHRPHRGLDRLGGDRALINKPVNRLTTQQSQVLRPGLASSLDHAASSLS